MDVSLIPVNTCCGIRWEKPETLESNPVYFYENFGDPKVPDGINFRFLPIKASENANRHQLFERLGVKSLSVAAICGNISRSLATNDVPPSIDLAISHTKYLFRHRDDFSSTDIRYWAVIDGKASTVPTPDKDPRWQEACNLYFNDPRYSPHTISHLLQSMDRFYCLHPKYLQPDPSLVMEDWMDWLKGNGISAIPRPSAANNRKAVSVAFESFAMYASEDSLCKVISTGWDLYKLHLPIITNLLKPRFDRRVLPTKDLQWAAKDLNVPSSWNCFLDIEVGEKDKTNYHLLSQFGLITNNSELFYLEVLRYHQVEGRQFRQPSIHLLSRIYTSLQSCSDDAIIR